MKQIWSLQYLRALAALSVVAFHDLEGTHFRFLLGRMGVDIFFVLSGFLMFALTQNRRVTPVQFLADRLARIAPIYWIATLGFFAVALLAPGWFEHAYADADLLLHSLLFLPHAHPEGPIWPTLFLGWTLNYEMFFYVLFACALPLPAAARLVAMTAGFAALVAAGLLWQGESPYFLTYTSPLVLEFLAGSWLGFLLMKDGARPNGALAVAALGAAMLLAAAWMPTLIYGWPAVLLVGAAVVLELRWMPKIGWLKRLGDASYSIYLFQQFGFELTRHLLRGLAGATHLPFDHRAITTPLLFAGAVGFGLAAHLWLEIPLTRAMRGIMGQIIHRPARLATEMPATCAAPSGSAPRGGHG